MAVLVDDVVHLVPPTLSLPSRPCFLFSAYNDSNSFENSILSMLHSTDCGFGRIIFWVASVVELLHVVIVFEVMSVRSLDESAIHVKFR